MKMYEFYPLFLKKLTLLNQRLPNIHLSQSPHTQAEIQPNDSFNTALKLLK